MEEERASTSSPLVGEAGRGREPLGSLTKTHPAADAAAPPPNPPHKGEGFKRLTLPAGATARARQLRRDMTAAERRLWAALRTTFPDAHWRKQVPFGSYFADFCSHGAKLIIEVDGGQHASALDADQRRSRFLELESYRVLRFWNNKVNDNLGGVLQAIAATLSSPLVGEDRGGGRDASASQETHAVASSLPVGEARQ